MSFVEKNSDKDDCYSDILQTAPRWLIDEINTRNADSGRGPLPFKGVPNDQGSPEQLDANLHVLNLRKLELLKQEARNIRR